MAKPARHYGKWRIRWTDHAGQRQSQVFDDYQDAQLALHRHHLHRLEIQRGLRPVPPPRVRFDALADHWLERRGCRKRSVKDDISILKCHLRPAFGVLFVDDITPEHIDLFSNESRVAPKSLHNHLTLLATLLHYAEELGWIHRAPRVRKPKLPKRPYSYLRTQEEIARFLRAAAARSRELLALYATAVYTGMRAGELAGLRWEDVDFDKRLILVQRSYDGPTKNSEIRYVPILDALLPILREWRLSCGGSVAFPNRRGRVHQPSARVFQEIFKQVLADAGFPSRFGCGGRAGYIRFHDLRHTFASHWVMNEGDLFKLQQILGHQSTQMTLRYAHLSPDRFFEDRDRLPALSLHTSRACNLSVGLGERARS